MGMPYEEFSDRDRERITKAHDSFLKMMICDMCSLADVFGVSRDDLFDRALLVMAEFSRMGGTWERFDVEAARERIYEGNDGKKKGKRGNGVKVAKTAKKK